MNVIDDKAANNKKACEMIAKSAESGADIAVLPEMFNCPYDTSVFSSYAEELSSENTDSSITALKGAARANNIYVFGGTIPELENGKLYNTCFCFGRKGEMLGRYRKVNLFDIKIPGKINFRESDVLSKGGEITVIDTEFGKIGIAICFDLRFPEHFNIMRQKGAELVIVPGSFNMTTGPAHWELLIRARAVDNQVHIAACSSARNVQSGYISYANSIAADPWGSVIVNAGTKENISYAVVDLGMNERIRTQIPLT